MFQTNQVNYTFHTLQWVWGGNWQLQYISVRGLKLWLLLLDRLSGVCCNEVTQVLVHGATVVICTLGNSGVQVIVALRSATPVRPCRFRIMSRWSLDLSITSLTRRSGRADSHKGPNVLCALCPVYTAGAITSIYTPGCQELSTLGWYIDSAGSFFMLLFDYRFTRMQHKKNNNISCQERDFGLDPCNVSWKHRAMDVQRNGAKPERRRSIKIWNSLNRWVDL